MKKIIFYLCIVLLSAACSKDGGKDQKVDELSLSQKNFSVVAGGEVIRVDVTTNTSFNVQLPGVSWVRASQIEQSTETRKYFDIMPNETYDPRTAEIVFTTPGGKTETVTVKQKETFTISSDANRRYTFDYKGGDITFDVTHNTDFDIVIPTADKQWIVRKTTTSRALSESTVSFEIKPNNVDPVTNNDREGTITLTKKDDGAVVHVITVSQTGYTLDGYVNTLQTASEGNGVDIIFMGDGFTGTAINNGRYMDVMNKSVDYFFSAEPYKSFRHLFNIYVINVVSPNAEFGVGNASSSKTALKGWMATGNSTSIGGDNTIVRTYALKAISQSRMNEALLIVTLNSRAKRAGTAYWWTGPLGDHGSGQGIAWQSQSTSDADYKGLLIHECGHGFAKLEDEYIYSGNDGDGVPYSGLISGSAMNNRKDMQNRYGWYKNVDFSADLTQTRWGKFATADPRYTQSSSVRGLGSLGTYEGARYNNGVWRSTSESIMKSNYDVFNAPSREAIYYRIHKLAYGSSWVYNFSDFLAWDARNYTAAAATAYSSGGPSVDLGRPMGAPPVVHNYSWEEEYYRK